MVVAVVNAVLLIMAPMDLVQAGLGFGIALPCIASSRILFNLRKEDKLRNARLDVDDVSVDSWQTIFHIT